MRPAGERRRGPADFTATPAPDRTVARAITGYADRCREQLDQTTTSVVSHAGLWLLLASAAEHAIGEDRAPLEEILGMPLAESSAAARRLLAAPHPTLAAAAGAWAAADAVTPVGVERPIPDQTALDAWTAEHTRGLIDRFPLEVTELTRIVLATALVLEPRWTERLVADGAWLRLTGGLQTIVETRAAGLVVVAKPHSQDGIDVISVRAHPRTGPAQVWQAVDEVVALLDDGGCGMPSGREVCRPTGLVGESGPRACRSPRTSSRACRPTAWGDRSSGAAACLRGRPKRCST